MNKGIVMPTIPVSIKRNTSSGSPLAEGSDLNVNVNMSMDGKTLSKAQGEYISDEIGSRVDRIEKYT